MEESCYKLKNILEHCFSMPFDVSSIVVDGEIQYICSPSNEGARFFEIKAYIHNHIRLVIEMYPQKHGGYILNEMSSADEEKVKRFLLFKEMLEDKDARISFLVNGSNLFNEKEWPNVWRMFSCKIVLVPIPDSEGKEREFSVIAEWMQYSFELLFSLLTITDIEEDTETEAIQTEGTATEIRSIRYERNPINRQLCLHRKGYNCAVCGMNFYDVYGEIGYHFIEVHHTTPVSIMGDNYHFDVDRDLVPLCPNCHAMVHRRNPPYSVEEMKKIIKSTEYEKK